MAHVELPRGDRLSYRVVEGPNVNDFFKSSQVAAHLLVSNGPHPRAAVSFPSGNAGAGLFLERGRSGNSGVELRSTGLQPKEGDGTDQRAATQLFASASQLTFRPLLDTNRALRDVTEGPGWPPADGRPRARFDVSMDALGETTVRVTRAELDGRAYELTLSLPAGTKAHVDAATERITLSRADGNPIELRMEARVPYPPKPTLPIERLIRPEALELLESRRLSKASAEALLGAVRTLQFLAFADEFHAGSWRFQTYFGRDLLLSSAMLAEMLTEEAKQAVLGAVLDRVSPDGRVAHEEDNGGQAARRHLAEGRLEAAAREEPINDYQMVDDDFYLPVVLADYLKTAAPGRVEAFLDQLTPSGKTRQEAVRQNAQLVLRKATAYARSGDPRDLIRMEPGSKVGNWRDSETGNGGGVIPGDINRDAVRLALSAIEQMGAAGLLGDASMVERARSLASAWSGTDAHFRVKLSNAQLRERLLPFLGSLGAPEREAALDHAIAPGCTLREYLAGDKLPQTLRDGLSFGALSLDERGRPVPVLNSDGCLRMFLGQPSAQQIEEILPLLELHYPLGLFTEAGMLVANPALSGSPELWQTLDRGGYHGSVIWGWQQGMMLLGLRRQIARFAGSAEHAPVIHRLEAVLTELSRAQERAGALVNSELWTFDLNFQPVPYGQDGHAETESNAAQLWNTVQIAIAHTAAREASARGDG